ncbi:unnamed protein product [Ambrosiozyma monospora]|uniref:Unnamed protein product n=1 Tax=Ambrosiozyma monospora TaxID=43982 RepID=A0ACB5T0G8_AMBMO|nr:unnamed protein product [Ambrosiozyma monospora]
MTQDLDYKQVAQNKRESNLAKIPKEWLLETVPTPEEQPNVNEYLSTIIPKEEQEITALSATQLQQKIKSGELSAYQITYAYCHRSALVHQLTNCLIEIFYDRALERAKEQDAYFKSTGKLTGVLHGIPISLKDQINVPGITTSLGYLAPHISREHEITICHNEKKDKHSLIAQILYDQGAIFYVKTTVPMAMLGAETSSNYAITANSIDRTKSPGGSSGGESSLLAAQGSVIGLGTDIGGSIRGPCTQLGLFGLRASSNRFPYLDISNSYPNQITVPSVVGPMCRYLEDLELVSKIIIESQPWLKDPKCLPIEWKSKLEIDPKKVKFGVMPWDHEVMPHPPILRCLNEVQQQLSQNGVQAELIKEAPPVKHSSIANLLTDLYTCDNFQEITKFCELSGEPHPDLLKRSFNLPGKVDNLYEYMDKVEIKYKFQQAYDKFFNDKGYDAMIVPGWSSTSWTLGDNGKIANSYTRYLNPLDYTVLTVPVGKVDERDVEFERKDEEFGSAQDKISRREGYWFG